MQARRGSPPDAASTSSSTLVSLPRSYESTSALESREDDYPVSSVHQRFTPTPSATGSSSSRRRKNTCPPDHRCDEDATGLGLCACVSEGDSPATPDRSDAEESGNLTPRARDRERAKHSLREGSSSGQQQQQQQSPRRERRARREAREAGRGAEGTTSSYRGLTALEEQTREHTTSPRRNLASWRSPRPSSESSASSSSDSLSAEAQALPRQRASSPIRASPRMASTARRATSSPPRPTSARQSLDESGAPVTSAERARLAGVYANIEAANQRARLASRARSEERRKRLGMGPPPWLQGADLINWHPTAVESPQRAGSGPLTEDALAMLAAIPDVVAPEAVATAPTTLVNSSAAALRLSRQEPEAEYHSSDRPPSPTLIAQRRLTQITSSPKAASYAERINALRGSATPAPSSARRISLRRNGIDSMGSGSMDVSESVSGQASRHGMAAGSSQRAETSGSNAEAPLDLTTPLSSNASLPPYLEEAPRGVKERVEEEEEEDAHDPQLEDEASVPPLVSPIRAFPLRSGNQLGSTSAGSPSFIFPPPSPVRVGLVQTSGLGSPNATAGPSRFPADAAPSPPPRSPLLTVPDTSVSLGPSSPGSSAPGSPRRHRRGGTPTLSISARAPGSATHLREAINTALDVPTEEASWTQSHWARSPPELQFDTSIVDAEGSKFIDNSSRRSVRFSPQPPNVRFFAPYGGRDSEGSEDGVEEEAAAPDAQVEAQAQAPSVDLAPAARAAELSGFLPRPPGGYDSPARPSADASSPVEEAPTEGVSRFYFPPRRSPKKTTPTLPATPRRSRSPPLSRAAQKAAASLHAGGSSSLIATPRAPGAYNVSRTSAPDTSLSLSTSLSSSGQLGSLTEGDLEEEEEEEGVMPSSIREQSRSRSASGTPGPRASTPPRLRGTVSLPSVVSDQSVADVSLSMDEYQAMPMVQRVQTVLEAMELERKMGVVQTQRTQQQQQQQPVIETATASTSKEAVAIQPQVQGEKRKESSLMRRLSQIRAQLAYVASAFRQVTFNVIPDGAAQLPQSMRTFYIAALTLQLVVAWMLLQAAEAGSDWYFRTTYYDPFYPMLYPEAPLVLFGELPPRFSLYGRKAPSWLPSPKPALRLIVAQLRQNWEPVTSMPVVQNALLKASQVAAPATNAASEFFTRTFGAQETDYSVYFPV